MTTLEVQVELGKLLQQIKESAYVEGYNATDEEAMGLVISKYFEWDGISILKASARAVEDANYHSEASAIYKMVEALEK
jgi:hypothetical protein